jgi:[protein-PII] uridylyltransferase
MNEVGLLGAFIPEFGRVVSMMQFNMYHHYTVDEHIIQTISALSQIERRELKDELPIATEIVAKGVNRRILYVALLLHDIGKGSGRDHSEHGAEIARRLAPRFGLSEEESRGGGMAGPPPPADVGHRPEARPLRSAHGARLRRRGEEPDAAEAADAADGLRHPRGRAGRVEQLEGDAAPGALQRGAGAADRRQPGREPAGARGGRQGGAGRRPRRLDPRRRSRPRSPGTTALLARPRHPRPCDLRRARPKVDAESAAMHFEHAPERDATLACFAMQDHPGIFARLAGALAVARANVVDARTYTTSDGLATAAFWIQDLQGKPYERFRLGRLQATVGKILRGEVVAREALRDRDRIKKRERDFLVPTSIHFDNTGSDIYTIIEVETRDRPGLLHDLARTLTANNISIASAIIATYGEQAVDVFYVKDVFGLKLHSEAKRRTLEARLRAAITPLPVEGEA